MTRHRKHPGRHRIDSGRHRIYPGRHLIYPGHPLHEGKFRRTSDAFLWSHPLASRVALLGLPDDFGVELNGGRPGAARGPAAFREALVRYGSDAPPGIEWPPVFDFGDVTPGETLEETHHRVSAQAAQIVSHGLVLVGIGGGHDLTFALVRGAMWGVTREEHQPNRDEWYELIPPLGPGWAGIYLDAHLDVRPEEGSGMPFHRLVEECEIGALHVRGLDPLANSAEHLEWFRANGGLTEGFGPEDPWPGESLFLSLDLDVLDQSVAPGVSAPNPSGWGVAEAAGWARAAGRCPRVRVFDIMELSPPHDEGGRTARAAVRLFLEFLAGMAERPWLQPTDEANEEEPD